MDLPQEKSTNQLRDSENADTASNSDAKSSSSTPPRFTRIFEMGKSSVAANVCRPSVEDVNSSTLAQIAQYVATTGEMLNINDINQWLKERPEQQCHFIEDDIINGSKSILCMPIINGRLEKNVIGVLVYVHVSTVIIIIFNNTWYNWYEVFTILRDL